MGLLVRLCTPYLTVNAALIFRERKPAMISALIAAITRSHARARAAAILNQLDDHRLRDIGIARDQIDLFVAGKI
jgi:uncharacterized protein YjiS (DUF1127 family)